MVPDCCLESENHMPSNQEFDNRVEFYRDLRELWEQEPPPNKVKLAIVLYGDADGPVRMVGEWTGDKLYRALHDQVLSDFSDRGNWYRIGRSRLGFLSTDFETNSEFVDFLKRFTDTFREPLTVDELTVDVDVSVGATHGLHSLDDLDELLFEVEGSATLAAEKAWSSYEFFYGGKGQEEGEGVNVVKDLYPALENNEFVLYYQPIVSLEDGSIQGAEALIRWDHPDRGLIFPGDFIPVAERSGLIMFLGSWVLEQGIREISSWEEGPMELPRMSINLSPKQFRDPNLAKKIESMLDDYDVEPSRLQLEITEQAVIEDRTQARGQLSSLIDVGIRVAMDDFGTGYSTLSQLSDLPIHVLKLDRSFIVNTPPTQKERSVVEIIINSGKTMGLKLLCEGIETPDQWNWMRDEKCDLAQGFLIAPGMPPDVFRTWIERYNEVSPTGDQPPTFPDRSLVRDYLPGWYEGTEYS